MLDFNYGYIFLAIGFICILREFIQTFIDIEKGVFVYGEEKHSIEHISYLSIYVFAIGIYFIQEFTGLDSAYFEVMLGISTIILTRHLRKERNHK